MNMDFLTLRCFLEVARTQSVSKAADKVCRTQSAVSQKILKLERLLGQRLFERSGGKQMLLTHEGLLFQNDAQRLVLLYEEMTSRLAAPEVAGGVRFGLPEDCAAHLLESVLVGFAHMHPKVTLSVECDLTDHLLQRFQADALDLILIKVHPEAHNHQALDLWEEPLHWVRPKGPMLWDRSERDEVPLVLSPEPCVYRMRAIEALNQAGLKWHVIFSSPSHAGKLAALKAGLGVMVLPKYMIQPECMILTPENHKKTTLPPLKNTHLSLIKKNNSDESVNSLEAFLVEQLRCHFVA